MEASEEAIGLTRHADLQHKTNEILCTDFALRFFVPLLLFLSIHGSFASIPKEGFFLSDNVQEVTFKFHTLGNLILLPVTINDTVHVNLILDTGCRNLLLFGKRFEKFI